MHAGMMVLCPILDVSVSPTICTKLCRDDGMEDITGLSPVETYALVRVQVPLPVPNGSIAQMVEHQTENLGVGGSIPPRTTINI